MRKHDTTTEKEPKKTYYKPNRELIEELKGSIAEKEESPACSQQALEKESPPEHLLKLAALLKKWRWQRRKFWMKMLAFSFFLAYIALGAFPTYLAWSEKYGIFEDWSRGGKIFLTFACVAMVASAIVAGWGSYKKWVKRNEL